MMPGDKDIHNDPKHNTNGFKQRPQDAGRPKGVKNRSTIAKKWLDYRKSVKAKGENPDLTEVAENWLIESGEKFYDREDLMTIAQIDKAEQEADTPAYKAIMDSAYGPAQTNKTVDGDDNKVNLDLPDKLDQELDKFLTNKYQGNEENETAINPNPDAS